MGAVEVDGDDLLRVGNEVGEDVAAAGGDRDEARLRPEAKRLHVDHRIFPDLRVDEALEDQREQSL
jgi:hypothetical protein